MFQEFKTFIMRGNVIDLAVGVIIGAAFGKIVTSLVDDIISFLIVALAVFLIVKQVNRIKSAVSGPVKTESATKECPFCATAISIKARRCPNCTSELGAGAGG